MKKELHIYPTSRSIRAAREAWRTHDALMPTLMRIDEFEQRCVHLEGRAMVDPLQRVLLLRRAADFAEMEVLRIDRALVRFFAHSEGLFRFFEELAREGVDCHRLAQADAYAEYGKHLAILSRLRERYREQLEALGLTDTMFVPELGRFRAEFVRQYERIEVFLEGLLSRYEIGLLEEAAKHTELIVHYVTTPYSTKMEERFGDLGISLPQRAQVRIDLSTRRVVAHTPQRTALQSEVVAVSERIEQVAEVYARVQQMIDEGIAADRIAVVLPDERFKELFRLYDRLNNFNFAMGFDYTGRRGYTILDAVARLWSGRDKLAQERIDRLGLDREAIGRIDPRMRSDVESFLARVESLVPFSESDASVAEAIDEARHHFGRVFARETLTQQEWLHLWLRRLRTVRIDDVRGGLVTVMGVLETRGVAFDGVVIVDFNDGIVPAMPAKDRFLNSQVRAFAGLPTRADREALQKHYYHRLLSQAKASVILFTRDEERTASKFLYELGLEEPPPTAVPYALLYDRPSRLVEPDDPVVKHFDATSIVWSPSRLGVWLGCKRQYYYRYIRRLRPPEDETINEGSMVHELLERLYQDDDHFETSQKLRVKLHGLIDEILPKNTPRVEYYKQTWRDKLEPFIEHQIAHFNNEWRVIEREKTVQGRLRGLTFRGRIDRIDRRDGAIRVIDYKTGSLKEANRTGNLEKTSDFQMNIYRRLLRERFERMELMFLSVFEGKCVEAQALDAKDDFLDEHLDELKDTREFVAEKCDDYQRCRYCEFALMCGRGEYA
jgi:RecB family exonuclease